MTDLDRGQLRLLADETLDRFGDVGYEPLAAVSVLWSGWECDSVAALVRLSDGSLKIVFVDGTGMSGGLAPEALLEERLVAYETAIRKTRAFLDRLTTERALAILDRAPEVPPEPGDEGVMTEEPKREWRWLCTACWTEGRGHEPAACPTCGSTDAWYEYKTSVDDTEPARARLKRLLVPRDAGDEAPE